MQLLQGLLPRAVLRMHCLTMMSAAVTIFVFVLRSEERIRTFETATRNTLDLAAIPLLKSKTHLPVIVDPSHATGIADLVKPMAMAAAAAGADGLMIEVHNDPPHALCDGAQSLTPEKFDDLIRAVTAILPHRYTR